MGRAVTSSRFALAAFVAATGAALPLWLVLGRDQWFTYDEWDFLAGRSATDLDDLLRPHGGHWSTLPVLVYRSLWRVVGLRTYFPYQLLVVLLHLTVASLLRVVMRRAGVGAWVATAAAALFAFFGAGYTNIIDGFQIGLVGSLVFGLSHLLFSDHDGPFDRRDTLGLGAGLAGVLCSGIGVPMTIVVGLAVLLRRGWRIAFVHTAPLGVVFLVWSLGFPESRTTFGVLTPATFADFVASNVRATFVALGQLPGVGIALGALLVLGVGLTWARLRSNPEQRARAAAPAALLVGAFLFLVITGIGRAGPPRFGYPTPEASRYMHVTAALTLPALAVAADAVVRRWRQAAPLVLALFLVGIPGNVEALADHMDGAGPFNQGFRQQVLSLPRSPVARRVPRWVRPVSELAPQVTIGWLLDAAASGRLPHPGQNTPPQAAKIRLLLSLAPNDKGAASNRCEMLSEPTTRVLERGDSMAVTGSASAYIHLRTAEGLSAPLLLRAPRTLIAVVESMTIDAWPAGPGVMLCE